MGSPTRPLWWRRFKAPAVAPITTAQAIREAFTYFGIKKLVLISPYVKQTNEHEVHYLTETGFTVLHELGLGLESDGYSAVTPEEWIKIVKENTRPDADGYFLSCTNTRMIEAINDLSKISASRSSAAIRPPSGLA